MADTARRIIRHGDTTEVGGVVVAPGTNHTIMGRKIANVACLIECPACNSTGSIRSVPPMPTYFDYGGVRAAFEGDLCICACSPYPRLLSSLTNWSASSFEAPIASTPAAADWLVFAGHDPEDHGIEANQQFVLVDVNTGTPLANFPYRLECDGQVLTGLTDAAGLTQTIHSLQVASSVHVYLGTPA